MLMVVVAVVGMCIYFMMSRESAIGYQNLRAGHSVAGASGQANVVVPPGISTAYTDYKIISFDPQTGDIDDTITLGNITQNAYYLAEQGRLDMMDTVGALNTTSSAARNDLNTKITNLSNAIKGINKALVGETGNPIAGQIPAKMPTARKFMQKEQDYRIMVAQGNQNPGTYLFTGTIPGWDTKNKRLTRGEGNAGTANYYYKFQDPLETK